eukprot:TRINITY_DN8632_c0_g1_i1.p1 TRINITY_DN8632_c0_g1~~TRINITY_DN8632_c0_g1_i1.p1  ORF type:complete len:423 (+),score=75.94 TRINITY_DN8632_c0_g1_i1:76-1344(+)
MSATSHLNIYSSSFQKAISSNNLNNQLSGLLRKNILSKFAQLDQQTLVLDNLVDKIPPTFSIDSHFSTKLASPWDEIASNHIRCIVALKKNNFVDAYNNQSIVAQTFQRVLSATSGNSLASPLSVVNSDLRMIAKLADSELRRKGLKEDKLEDAARILNSCFSICIKDNSADTKKYSTLGIVCNLFKIYFELNHLRLCRNLIKPLEQANFPIKLIPEDNSKGSMKFPIGQVVTYKFYTGRLKMFNSQFKGAEEDLDFAFKRCSKLSLKNKKLILMYLIPVKILLGKMPTESLLDKYGFTQFQELVKAIQVGNLKSFSETLDKYQDFFIQKGTFLILEKSKILAYRSLFKRIVEVANNTKIPLSYFEKAFLVMGYQIEMEEIECILANLIFTNYMKGYISHSSKVIVVSKNNPFPQISSIATE